MQNVEKQGRDVSTRLWILCPHTLHYFLCVLLMAFGPAISKGPFSKGHNLKIILENVTLLSFNITFWMTVPERVYWVKESLYFFQFF